MDLIRLHTPADVLEHWDIFRIGHAALRQLSKNMCSENAYCKSLTNLAVGTDDVFIGVIRDGAVDVCYGVAVNSTPPYSDRRTFEVVTFYHNPTRSDATQFMQAEFESWLREQGVSTYLINTRQTRRTSGGTIDCFTSGKYGFRPAYLTFEKKL